MDTLKINKAPSEGRCSKCARNQKQIAKLKKAFIHADDENVRLMQYEDKILEFKAELEWLKAEDSSVSEAKNGDNLK